MQGCVYDRGRNMGGGPCPVGMGGWTEALGGDWKVLPCTWLLGVFDCIGSESCPFCNRCAINVKVLLNADNLSLPLCAQNIHVAGDSFGGGTPQDISSYFTPTDLRLTGLELRGCRALLSQTWRGTAMPSSVLTTIYH